MQQNTSHDAANWDPKKAATIADINKKIDIRDSMTRSGDLKDGPSRVLAGMSNSVDGKRKTKLQGNEYGDNS